MILINKDNLGPMPIIIVASAMISAIVVAVMASLFIIRSPVIFVPGAKAYMPAITPGDPDVKYVLAFASTYFEKYAVWNKYTFDSNRQWVLFLSDKPLGNTIAEETKNTGYVVGLLQKSQQARISGTWYKQIGRRWYVQFDYERRQYDGSVARLNSMCRAILVINPVLPTSEYQFGCETTAIIDGLTSEVEALQDATPVQLQAVAAPTAPVEASAPVIRPGAPSDGDSSSQVQPEAVVQPDASTPQTQPPASR